MLRFQAILFAVVASCAPAFGQEPAGAAHQATAPDSTRLAFELTLPAEGRAEAAADTERLLRGRLEAMGLAVTSWTMDENGRLLVEIAGLPAAEVERTARACASHEAFRLAILFDERDDVDVAAETARLLAWTEDHPSRALADFARLAAARGGPQDPRLEWIPMSAAMRSAVPDEHPYGKVAAVPVRRSDPASDLHFGSGCLKETEVSEDREGHPAVRFELREDRLEDFGRFTDAHLGKRMAIILGGEVHSAPLIATRLPEEGMITGGPEGFTRERAQAMAELMLLEALPVPVRWLKGGA